MHSKMRISLALLAIIGGLVAAGQTASATAGDRPGGSGAGGWIFDGTLTPGTKVIRAKDVADYPTPRLLWSKDYSGETQGQVNAVDVRSGRLFVKVGPCADCENWLLHGFDATTGAVHSAFTLPYYFKYAIDDTSLYLQGRNVDTGRPVITAITLGEGDRWRKEYRGVTDITTAGSNGKLYAMSAGPFSTFDFQSIDPADGNVLWENGVLRNYVPTKMRVIGSGLFIAQGCGNVARVDAAVGRVVWSHRTTCSNDIVGTPAAYGGRLYVQVTEQDYNVLDSHTGTLLATRTWDRMPVIDGRVGYFIRDGILTAVDLKLSKTLWQLHVTRGVSSVVAKDGLVSVTAGTGVMYLVEMWTGKVRWALHSSGESLGGVIGSGIVAVPSKKGIAAYTL